jgi:hypothetical protein
MKIKNQLSVRFSVAGKLQAVLLSKHPGKRIPSMHPCPIIPKETV